jgi:hypothetical protein
MEICMLNKLASSFILASALVGTIVAPCLAGDDESTFQSIVNIPVRVVGAGVGGTVGVPLGAVKDGVKGWMLHLLRSEPFQLLLTAAQ